jgi:hypothetical protein
VIEVHKSVSRPYPLSQFLALDYLSGLFQKNVKNLKRLFLEPDLVPILAQFSGASIKFELPKSDGSS